MSIESSSNYDALVAPLVCPTRVAHQLRPFSQLARALGKPCPYCDKPMRLPDRRPTKDHLLSRVHRALLHDETRAKLIGHNLTIVCNVCNHTKKSHTLADWLVRLAAGRDPRAVFVQRFIDKVLTSAPTEIGHLLCYGRMP